MKIKAVNRIVVRLFHFGRAICIYSAAPAIKAAGAALFVFGILSAAVYAVFRLRGAKRLKIRQFGTAA